MRFPSQVPPASTCGAPIDFQRVIRRRPRSQIGYAARLRLGLYTRALEHSTSRYFSGGAILAAEGGETAESAGSNR